MGLAFYGTEEECNSLFAFAYARSSISQKNNLMHSIMIHIDELKDVAEHLHRHLAKYLVV